MYISFFMCYGEFPVVGFGLAYYASEFVNSPILPEEVESNYMKNGDKEVKCTYTIQCM